MPGNLNIKAAINTDGDINTKGNISTNGQINGGTMVSSNLVASGRNILAELTSLKAGLDRLDGIATDYMNYKGGMRLFTMNLTENKNTLVKDPWGKHISMQSLGMLCSRRKITME